MPSTQHSEALHKDQPISIFMTVQLAVTHQQVDPGSGRLRSNGQIQVPERFPLPPSQRLAVACYRVLEEACRRIYEM